MSVDHSIDVENRLKSHAAGHIYINWEADGEEVDMPPEYVMNLIYSVFLSATTGPNPLSIDEIVRHIQKKNAELLD